jgi:hypothetical protein
LSRARDFQASTNVTIFPPLFFQEKKPESAKKSKKDENGAEDDEEVDDENEEAEDEEYELNYGEEIDGEGEIKALRVESEALKLPGVLGRLWESLRKYRR